MSIIQHTIEASGIEINPAMFASIMGVEPDNIPEPYAGLIQEEIELIKTL
jgi:hypothetical protein